MPSTRRRFLATVSASAAVAFAGCSAFGSDVPDVETNTGLRADDSATLDGTTLLLAGDTSALPTPPETTDDRGEADAVLASADADSGELAAALRQDTTVAVTGDGATETLVAALDAASDTHQYGVERAEQRPVSLVVADPVGRVVHTHTFVREGGWADPVLDPLGWAVGGRFPDAETFVPENEWDDEYETLGTATVAGRLESGEAYAMRTQAEVVRHDDAARTRFNTRVHAAAGDGFGVSRATRKTGTGGSALLTMYPNPHTKRGVETSNHSSTDTLSVDFSPVDAESRAALTGQCGATVDGHALAYDWRGEWEWRHDGFLSDDYREASVGGNAVWRVHP